jgi:SAM-dependent methyltransferase
MQAYGQDLARVYNNYLAASFAALIGPQLLEFYASTPIGQVNRLVLDIGCGTGHLARYLLDHRCQVMGIDLSPHMLRHAREKTCQYVEEGLARFILADASAFKLEKRFGLVVSTSDTFNHLGSPEVLQNCFRCIYDVLVSDGFFIFDLNTRLGLTSWKDVDLKIEDGDTELGIKGCYDEQGSRAWMIFSGGIYGADGSHTSFEEIVFETIFDLDSVRAALLEIGWSAVYFATPQDLAVALAVPERETKVVVVARK